MELISSIGFILLIFMVVVVIVMEKTSEGAAIKTLLDARRVSETVKDNINMISQQGPGYYSHFSLPQELSGGYEYDVNITNNVLEVMWGENAWTTRLATSNVTVHCLSKGIGVKNRIFYGADGLEVTCHLPNLRLDGNDVSVNQYRNETRVTIRNDAHVPSDGFLALMKTNGSQSSENVPPLAAYESVTVRFNGSVSLYAAVWADYTDAVNESIESDNYVNVTLA